MKLKYKSSQYEQAGMWDHAPGFIQPDASDLDLL
jgi:hypothetical protein